jgi:glycerophosphoryl diester phosphodiesterase
MKDFICIAHRGASGHAPENTLMAVRMALDMGAAWIEVDVHLVEGELVVIHDSQLDRTTNGTGSVSERPLSYIRSLDAGSGERIPLLSEVLDLAANRAGIHIELKGDHTAGPVAAMLEARMARGGPSHDRVIVSSFDTDLLLELIRREPAIPVGVLLEKIPPDYAKSAEEMGAFSVHVDRKVINERFVEDAHARGLKVFTYTINRPEEVHRMRRLGVDGIFTDYPELCAGEGHLPRWESRAAL